MMNRRRLMLLILEIRVSTTLYRFKTLVLLIFKESGQITRGSNLYHDQKLQIVVGNKAYRGNELIKGKADNGENRKFL